MFSFFNKKDNSDEKKSENESKGFFSSLKETFSKTSKSLCLMQTAKKSLTI